MAKIYDEMNPREKAAWHRAKASACAEQGRADLANQHIAKAIRLDREANQK